MKSCVSIGCIDYGNNNFFEIMSDGNTIELSSHDHDECTKNSDGTFDCESITLADFVRDVFDRDDFDEIMANLTEVIANRIK